MAWRTGWRNLLRRRATAVPRTRLRLTLLARLRGLDEAKVSTLQEVAEQGDAIARLMAHPDWPAFLRLKDELQGIATEQARSVTATDRQRAEAAASYWALEGLVGAVTRLARNGQRARDILRATVMEEEATTVP